MENNINSQNYSPVSVINTLESNQKPLGTQFKSYQLNGAINHYLLDPFQYTITKFDYYLPSGQATKKQTDSISGLVYKNVDFDTILPSFTAVKKSVNDFPAQDYHRFLANDGYFNPQEATNNTDLWFYGAEQSGQPSGPAVNVQEVNHIIFPEAQRGGTDTKNLAKYSWTSNLPKRDTTSWESINYQPVDNTQNCSFFNYNNGYTTSSDSFKNQFNKSFEKAYQFDSNYTRSIGISGPQSGSMPFAN